MKDRLKFSLVVPCYKYNDEMFRNIESILDQDYKNYEIIAIPNGEWPTKDELLSGLKERYGDKIQVHYFTPGGLGKANNLGIDLAKGDIISHFSSDLYMMPGLLRTWAEHFEDHPDYQFLYSGYKYIDPDPTAIYWSRTFDRYHLECEPFIDGANPYRREIAVKWNENLKSLIDWDWSLSLTDHGEKGYYIKEPLYYAEWPKPGGLSNDSTENWIKRRREIQALHGIPDRKMCVSSLIEPDYALEIAKMVGADFLNHPGYKPHDYNLIYLWGFPADLDYIRSATAAFQGHWKHKVIHWTGPDILQFMQLRWADVDYFTQMVLSKVPNQFCISQKDMQVLKRMHIDSELVYPPTEWTEKTSEKDGVSVNDAELMGQLKKAMPDVQFFLNDLDCRTTVHFQDNVARILQSLCRGNYVITEKYFPATYQIQRFNNVPELRKMVSHTVRQIQKTTPDVIKEDVNYYRERVKPGYLKNKLEKIAEKPCKKYARLEDITEGTKGVWGEA